ncbi:2-oxoacid:acceptor oxidoreductase subunit alpha [Candidatus Micrarchaeota archaeon]|nr:2-oxoacid:acceptor oxidoreductase subunit alpha [Candidatus Micrarchaeota archaeon]
MEQIVNSLRIKFSGSAGTGVAVLGSSFAKCLQRHGLKVYSTNDYPSLIKGGHNTVFLRAEATDFFSHYDYNEIDVLITLNKEGALFHEKELTPGGAIVYDGDKIKFNEGELTRKDIKLVSVPLSAIATKNGGIIMLNTVALGAGMGLLGMDLDPLYKIIDHVFSKKGDAVIAQNKTCAKEGYDAVASFGDFKVKIQAIPVEERMLINGNDGACVGAIRSGVKLIAEYPMSPSSSILHFMAAHEREYKLVVKHTEDEIAAMNFIVGAGATGVRALTATSGGGFSLMVEALGLAGISETPCVVINAQRCGPSTGLPTYTEQADLRFALHASQGEFPRIVLAPGDLNDCFEVMGKAFNFAERVQTPCVVLIDKFLAETAYTIKPFDQKKIIVNRGKFYSDEDMAGRTDYKRHEFTEDGVSPRAIYGQPNGLHVASSYEHDETGWTSEDAEMRIKQIEKRANKMKNISEEELAPQVYGNENPDVTIVCWGSTKLIAREALFHLQEKGLKVKIINYWAFSPFPVETTKKLLSGKEPKIIFEGNSEGQLRYYIREKTGLLIENAYLRFDGRPFTVPEIVSETMKVVKK